MGGTSEGKPKTEASKDSVKTKDSYPIAAGIIFINTEGEMLLMKRAGGDYPGYWGIPGGMINPDEDVEGAARRELIEETGYSYSGPLMRIDNNNGFVTFCATVSDIFPVKLNKEHSEFQWENPAFFVSGQLHPGVESTLQKLGY